MTTITLDPSQEGAVELVLSARVGVVTGGPGCGKTTCLRVALDRLDAAPGAVCRACEGRGWVDDIDPFTSRLESGACRACAGSGRVAAYALAAPTGKAARRLAEATGRTASTVHRLLEFGPLEDGQLGFRRNADSPLEAELVVIDEASMLDVELAAALLRAIDKRRTRLVLVGDAHQLPSVGPGQVFADLIASGRVPVARLTTLHRAAAESWVCTQSRRMLEGEVPDLTGRPDFIYLHEDDRDRAAATAVRAATDVLPRRGIGQDDIQVLVPQRIGPAGTEALNAKLQAVLNPSRDAARGWKLGAHTLCPGDRVIQTSNNYVLGVMNGEVGVVVSIRDEGTREEPAGLVVRYPDARGERRVTYSKLAAEGLDLAYALTVHKVQGSEWPWVVVLVHSTHTRMLTRRLLYTAITRAKVGVVLVGDRAGLRRAVENERDSKRNTGVVERLRAA